MFIYCICNNQVDLGWIRVTRDVVVTNPRVLTETLRAIKLILLLVSMDNSRVTACSILVPTLNLTIVISSPVSEPQLIRQEKIMNKKIEASKLSYFTKYPASITLE